MPAVEFQKILVKHRLTTGSWGNRGPHPLCCPMGAILLECHPKYQSTDDLASAAESDMVKHVSQIMGKPEVLISQFVTTYDQYYRQNLHSVRLEVKELQGALTAVAMDIALQLDLFTEEKKNMA